MSGLYFIEFITMVFADTLESGLKSLVHFFCVHNQATDYKVGVSSPTESAENPKKSRQKTKTKMNKIIPILIVAILLSSCVSTIQVACNTPGIEMFVNDNSYGESPATIAIKNSVQYIYVSCRKQGIEIHAQRVYIQKGVKYYEVEIPRNLRNSSNPNHSLIKTY